MTCGHKGRLRGLDAENSQSLPRIHSPYRTSQPDGQVSRTWRVYYVSGSAYSLDTHARAAVCEESPQRPASMAPSIQHTRLSRGGGPMSTDATTGEHMPSEDTHASGEPADAQASDARAEQRPAEAAILAALPEVEPLAEEPLADLAAGQQPPVGDALTQEPLAKNAADGSAASEGEAAAVAIEATAAREYPVREAQAEAAEGAPEPAAATPFAAAL